VSGSDVEHDPERKRFVARVDGMEATLEYDVLDERRVDFHRTYTPPPIRGRGVAKRVVAAALAWARAEGREVVPSCWYVREFLEKERS
jgi:predicted GNAT family acetyltransferase